MPTSKLIFIQVKTRDQQSWYSIALTAVLLDATRVLQEGRVCLRSLRCLTYNITRDTADLNVMLTSLVPVPLWALCSRIYPLQRTNPYP